MSKAGPEIIAALEDAAAGKFARVTIRGQAWVPETPLHRAAPELLEALKEAIEAVKIFHGPIAWDIYESKAPEMQRWKAAIARAENRS